MPNKLTRIAKEILLIEDDLPYRLDYNQKQKPTVDDFELYTFEQTWGSTALGFGGIGGQSITSAQTYVFVPMTCDDNCFVYFAGRYAYSVPYSRFCSWKTLLPATWRLSRDQGNTSKENNKLNAGSVPSRAMKLGRTM